MSDTTAFLSGCAVAGVATLFWLQGGTGFEKPNFSYSSPSTSYSNPSLAEPSNLNPSLPTPSTWSISPQIKQQLEQQHTQFEQLKTELEQQKAFNEQLKIELEQQKLEKQELMAQMQQQSLKPAKEQQNKLQIGMIWALGGIIIILVVGGSFMMIGIVALLLRPQKSYASRPTHVIHPLSLQDYGYSDYQGNVIYRQPKLRQVNEVSRDE